MFKMQIL